MTPSTSWEERLRPEEDAEFADFAQRLRAMQRDAASGGKADRALHGKANLGARATFTVLPDLPAHARVGLFAEPKTYAAYVRYSNGAGKRQSDRVGDVRGMAVKVLGVKGQKVIPGMEAATTQDFLMIRSRTMPFRSVREFVTVVTAAAGSPALALPKILWGVGFGRGLTLLSQLAKSIGAPVLSLAATTYYSPAPIRVGDHAARFQLTPHAKEATALRKGGPDYLGEELEKRLREGEVTYDFQLQFFVDETKTPIDDATREWRDEDSPPLTVARLTLSKIAEGDGAQEKVRRLIEELAFDPWHALVEHKPIGELMRARNHAYRSSAEERNARGEPDGSELA
jgi:hypothetical protein